MVHTDFMKQKFTQKLVFLLCLILIALCAGTSGYMLIEGWSFLDSLFMTVVTLSTIGYGETHHLNTAGQIFTIILIVFGTGLVGYGISSLTLMLFQGDLPHYLQRRKMEKIIARISGHIIICGLSRTGMYTLGEIERSGRQIVVIEKDEATIAKLDGRDIPYIVGDATADDNLLAAGVKDAQAIITCLTSDAENAFVVVTAKSLNPKIYAVSKSESENARRKLTSIGCDKVVIPSMLGGLNMANSVVRPETLHFFELLRSRYSDTFRAELVAVDAQWEGRSLAEFSAQHDLRMVVIALEHPGGEVEFDPTGEALLHEGTSIMAISNR
jgi:voltage-gated potassium channel